MLDGKWYKGWAPIDSLILDSCQLHTIRADAFVSIGMRMLRTLWLIDMHNFFLYIDGEILFAGLIFDNIHFRHIEDEILMPLRADLTTLDFSLLPDDIEIISVFGRKMYALLEMLRIVGYGVHARRHLDASNLPRTSRLMSLELIRCGIETIHPDTFDFVGSYLNRIDLSRNKLKSLSLRHMEDIFDVVRRYTRVFVYYGNPMECNCGLYEWQNMSVYNDEIELGEMPGDMPNCSLHTHCDNMQTVRINWTSPRRYWFTALDIRIIKERLIAYTKYNGTLRLLFQMDPMAMEFHENTKCPSYDWTQQTVRCIRFWHGRRTIPTTEIFSNSDLVLITPLLPIGRRVAFPLHIRTFRHTPKTQLTMDWLLIALEFIACGCGLALVAICLMRRRIHRILLRYVSMDQPEEHFCSHMHKLK